MSGSRQYDDLDLDLGGHVEFTEAQLKGFFGDPTSLTTEESDESFLAPFRGFNDVDGLGDSFNLTPMGAGSASGFSFPQVSGAEEGSSAGAAMLSPMILMPRHGFFSAVSQMSTLKPEIKIEEKKVERETVSPDGTETRRSLKETKVTTKFTKPDGTEVEETTKTTVKRKERSRSRSLERRSEDKAVESKQSGKKRKREKYESKQDGQAFYEKNLAILGIGRLKSVKGKEAKVFESIPLIKYEIFNEVAVKLNHQLQQEFIRICEEQLISLVELYKKKYLTNNPEFNSNFDKIFESPSHDHQLTILLTKFDFELNKAKNFRQGLLHQFIKAHEEFLDVFKQELARPIKRAKIGSPELFARSGKEAKEETNTEFKNAASVAAKRG